MTGAWAYVGRIDLRRRWRSLLALALVLGVAAGLVTATAASARRGSSAYTRLADATLRYDLEIQDDTEGAPMVAAAADLPGVIAHDQLSVIVGLIGDEQFLITGGASGDFGYEMDRPVVVEGRLPAPDATDEILLNEQSAADFHLAVGDTVQPSTFTVEQFQEMIFGGGDPGGPPAGPAPELTVVGVGKLPDDVDAPDAAGLVPAAVIDRLRGEAGGFDNVARVRLADGADPSAAVAALTEEPGYDASQVYVTLGEEDGQRVVDATAVEATSTWIIVAVATLALLFVAFLLVGRLVGGGDEEQRVLAAMGLDVRARRRASILPFTVVALVAALLVPPLALLASQWFPIGLSGHVEPSPGFDFDGLVVGGGALLTAFTVLLAATIASWRRTADLTAVDQIRERAHMPVLTAASRRLHLNPAGLVGVRTASGGSPDSRLAVRAGLISLTVGVVGAVAVVVFGLSLSSALEAPASYGVAWDVIVFTPDDPEGTQATIADLDADEQVEGFSVADVQTVELEGEDLPFVAVESRRGDVRPVLLSGRAPDSPDEVALASKTADSFGAGVGDQVGARTADGERQLTVVGRVLLPLGGDESGVGALVTPAGLAELEGSDGYRVTLVDLAPSVDPDVFSATHESETPEPPVSVVNLGRARGLPGLLGLFLVVLGTAGALFGIGGGGRRREMGILRSLGFDRHQRAGVYRWQATALGLAALAVGVPAGLIVGRAVWAKVAEQVGILTDVAPVVGAVALVVLATMLLALALGSAIGFWSAHRRTAIRMPE